MEKVKIAVFASVISIFATTTVLAHGKLPERTNCPCFTSAMIDAALVSLSGTLQNDDEDIPIPPSPANECTGPEGSGIGRFESEFTIFTTNAGVPLSELVVGTGFADEPVGICNISIDRGEGGLAEDFVYIVGGLSVRQVAACQREILRSLTWRQFCKD